jgi:peptide-methionine (S)-S-oxide reductase
VGYTGGTVADPTYRRLGDHTEALQIDFDPEVIAVEDLLDRFWQAHDATRPPWNTQYRAAFWYADERQRELALEQGARAAHGRGGSLSTAIEPLAAFYRAEDYHQKYRLRRSQAIACELLARYGSDRAMVDATASARLNGWLGGSGRARDWPRLAPMLALSPESEAIAARAAR